MSKAQAKPRLTREQSQAQTRERLIETAQQLFVANGYGGTSLRDIADKAGYSQGAFYSNFSNKEELLLELLRRHMQAEMTNFSRVMDDTVLAPEQMLASLETWAANLNQDADWCLLSIELQMHAHRSPAFAVAYQHVQDEQRQHIAEAAGRLFANLGRVPTAAMDDIATAFMALKDGLALQRASGRPDQSGRLVMLFLQGLIAGSATVDDRPDGAARSASAR